MNAACISEVLSAWEAAARSVGRNLPAGIVERGLGCLPDSPEWAINEDASELFALTKSDVVFSLGLSSDSEWRLRSRPLYADRLLVRLSWSQPEPTETGGLTWNTTWMFHYQEERGHDGWQRLRGSVIRDANGTERVDARERFARAIATRAGWAPAPPV
jgi:hypothetical protein